MTTTAKYKVGIVGCGRQGTQHGRGFNLLPDTSVVAIADPDPDNLELALRRFSARGYSTAEEMYANEQLDIVDCVLPVQFNPDMVVLAAETSGAKGIVSEKPIAASLVDADRMVAACEANGIPWQGGNVDRSISQLWEARALIEAGEIGEVLSINLYEMTMQGGCQGLSVAHMFAQDADIDWVTGWTNGDPFGESDDEYLGIGGYVRYANGVECFIHARTGAMRGLIVTGTEGVYVTDKRHHRFYHKSDASDTDLLSNLKYDDSKTFKTFSSSRRRRVRRRGMALPRRPARELHAVHRRRHHPRHRAEGTRAGPAQVVRGDRCHERVRPPGPCAGQAPTTRPQLDAQASDMAMGEQERTLRRRRVRPANRPRDQLLVDRNL